MRLDISLDASADRCARVLTSSATTAKPRPCSPALAASIAAFNASKLVWSEIPLIILTKSFIPPVTVFNWSTEFDAL